MNDNQVLKSFESEIYDSHTCNITKSRNTYIESCTNVTLLSCQNVCVINCINLNIIAKRNIIINGTMYEKPIPPDYTKNLRNKKKPPYFHELIRYKPPKELLPKKKEIKKPRKNKTR